MTKIFVSGLKKWARMNKVNQTSLGHVVGRDQTTISLYYQNKTRPSHDMIEKWVKHFDLDYEEIIEIGRHELTKSNSSELNEAEIRRIIREEQQAAQPPINITAERHRQLVDQFQQKDLALEINAELLDLEAIDKERLRSVLDFIKYQKKIAAEETAKKRAAANEDR